MQRVEDARLLGILLRHGFQWVDKTVGMAPVGEDTSNFRYLTAVIVDLGD